jgi:hypothetical protein
MFPASKEERPQVRGLISVYLHASSRYAIFLWVVWSETTTFAEVSVGTVSITSVSKPQPKRHCRPSRAILLAP